MYLKLWLRSNFKVPSLDNLSLQYCKQELPVRYMWLTLGGRRLPLPCMVIQPTSTDTFIHESHKKATCWPAKLLKIARQWNRILTRKRSDILDCDYCRVTVKGTKGRCERSWGMMGPLKNLPEKWCHCSNCCDHLFFFLFSFSLSKCTLFSSHVWFIFLHLFSDQVCSFNEVRSSIYGPAKLAILFWAGVFPLQQTCTKQGGKGRTGLVCCFARMIVAPAFWVSSFLILGSRLS